MDENTFFWEATKRICGSLDIEAGLFKLHKLLQEIMPLAMIYLQYYEPESNAMRTIATISRDDYQKQDLLTPLSKKAGYLAANTPTDIDAFLMEDPTQFPITRELIADDPVKPSSVAILALRVDENMLGFLAVTSEGNDWLTQEHLQMITLLKEPLSIAMSNTLRHRNELKFFNRDFFFEVTMRICGNLKIEAGLSECLTYISQYIPADRIYLGRFECDLMSTRLVARATSKDSEILNILVPLLASGKEKMNEVNELFLKGEYPPVLVIDDPKEEPITMNILKVLNEPVSSAMSMPLFVRGHMVGTVVLLAEGRNRYSQKHAKLFSTLKMPFYVAMANNLKHLEILKLKDLLADDNRYLQGELRRMHGEKIIGADFGLK